MMPVEWYVVPAAREHLLPMAADLRPADRREVWASHRRSPYEALAHSLGFSDRAWTAFVNDRPSLMWGVGRGGCILNPVGVPWMLATRGIELVAREFIRQSRAYVGLMGQGFSRLENYVHAENALSIRWLKWCGFTLVTEPTVFNGEDFHLFWRNA